jgi:hypothetical protein
VDGAAAGLPTVAMSALQRQASGDRAGRRGLELRAVRRRR